LTYFDSIVWNVITIHKLVKNDVISVTDQQGSSLSMRLQYKCRSMPLSKFALSTKKK